MGSRTRNFANNVDSTGALITLTQASVNAHATEFDDNKIVNDLSTLGLRVHTQENLNASNTNSQYVDVFNDNSGYTNGANTARNASEYVDTTTSSVQSQISFSGATATGNMTQEAGIASAIDGTVGGANYTNGARKDPSSGAHIGVDWGSGNTHIVTRYKIWGVNNYGLAGNTSSRYHKLQGSNDGASYTDLYTHSNTLVQSNMIADTTSQAAHDENHHAGNTMDISTAYRYHRILFEGDVNGGTVSEIQFFSGGGTTTSATGFFTCPAITSSGAISKMGAVITYQDNSGTNALNTDIVLQLSADNGSNFSTATLTALPDFSSGIKMAKVNDLSVTGGSQLKYKISFANQASGSKEAGIRGVSLNY